MAYDSALPTVVSTVSQDTVHLPVSLPQSFPCMAAEQNNILIQKHTERRCVIRTHTHTQTPSNAEVGTRYYVLGIVRDQKHGLCVVLCVCDSCSKGSIEPFTSSLHALWVCLC